MRMSMDERCMEPLLFQTHIFAVSSMQWGYAKRFFSQSSDPNKLMFEHNVLHQCVLKGCTGMINPSPSLGARHLWRSWRHQYDVIRSRDAFADITNWCAICHFLWHPLPPSHTPRRLDYRAFGARPVAPSNWNPDYAPDCMHCIRLS